LAAVLVAVKMVALLVAEGLAAAVLAAVRLLLALAALVHQVKVTPEGLGVVILTTPAVAVAALME
jgi:hypothetical protein